MREHLQAREERGSGAEGQQDTCRVVTRHGAHTESRMRENCTYGSMRGIRRKTAKHVLRVAEGRAGVPDNKGRPALLYTLVVLERYGEGIIGNVHQGQGESMSSVKLIVRKNHVDLFNRHSCVDDVVGDRLGPLIMGSMV